MHFLNQLIKQISEQIIHHSDNAIENTFAFIGGSGFVLLASIHFDLWQVVGKLGMTIAVGIIGGICGVLGKKLGESLFKTDNRKKK